MNYFVFIAMSLLLSACSIQLPEQPLAQQLQDLADADNDGVINARDLCADTPDKALVNNDGCPDELNLEKKQEMLVFFEHDSTEINAEQLAYIEQIAHMLQQKPKLKILLAGHASTVGSDAYNNKLAHNRALAVQARLIAFGAKQQQIEVTSYGSFKNLVEGESDLAHSANRRVYFAFSSSETDLVQKWHIFSPEELALAK